MFVIGYEKGSIFIYKRKFWLFSGYSTNKERQQTYLLRGLSGEAIEVLASDCFYLLSPTEIDFDELEKQMKEEK